MKIRRDPLTGTVLGESATFSDEELCRLCRVDTHTLVEMVTEGVLEPSAAEHGRWRFNGTALTRVQTVLRLQRDLGVNLPGAALALDLMDEIETLRRLCLQLGADFKRLR